MLVGISGFFASLFSSSLFLFLVFSSFLLRSAEAGSNKFNFVKLCWLMGFCGVLFLF